MKFTCSRAALLDPLLMAASVAPSRSVKPVLQNLRLDAKEGVLEIQGTDLETSLRLKVPGVETRETGSCLLPAGKLASIVRELDDGPVSFDTDQLLCRIQSAGASFRIQGGNADEFPEIPGFEEEEGLVQLPAATLRNMARKTVFAVSAEKTRYALNGVLLTLTGSRIFMVATDGRRLASSESEVKVDISEEKTAILPPKALNQLDRVLTSEDEFVGIRIEDGQLLVRTLRGMIAARLIEGKYPNLDAIIPPPGEVRVELERSELMAATRKAAIMTSEESKPVRLSVSSDRLVVAARSSDVGDAEVEIPLEGPAQGLDIGFNPTYLLDGLKAMESEKVVLELSAPNRAGRLLGDPGYLYVIMPISLG